MQGNIACIGFVIDGNRRWARERGLPTLEGHRKGFETLRDTVRLVKARGIAHMVVYTFSTENWNRSQEEVSYLMNLIGEAIRDFSAEAVKEGVRVRIVGQRERFSPELCALMEGVEADTAHNGGITVWLCLSYGGRAEVAAAAVAAAASSEITEASITNHLWTVGMPDPDLIIRTGGAKRTSNFLIWQSSYSEWFFLEPYWPDFNEKLLDDVLHEYAERERRFGK